MKHLRIVYADTTIFDGEVAEFTWQDSDNGVQVSGKTKPANAGGLVDLLTTVSKKMTEAKADSYREQTTPEPVAVEASDG